MSMKNVLSYILPFIKILVFWILIFDTMRILFILHNAGKVNAVGWLEVAQSFFYSLRLDLTAAAMLSILPFLQVVQWFFGFYCTRFLEELLLFFFLVFCSLGTFPEKISSIGKPKEHLSSHFFSSLQF